LDDTTQIIQALNLYALGVDSRRWELFDLVFAPDAEIIYPAGLYWTDLEAWKRDFETMHVRYEATMQYMSNHIVSVDGDRAASQTYGRWRLMYRDEAGDLRHWEGGGWYEDRLARTPQGWRITKRYARNCWRDGEPAPASSATVRPPSSEPPHSLGRDGQAGQLAIVQAVLAA